MTKHDIKQLASFTSWFCAVMIMNYWLLFEKQIGFWGTLGISYSVCILSAAVYSYLSHRKETL